MLHRYRHAGADLPFGDLRRAHGVGMEGYFWRFSDPGSGRVIVALCGVCRDRSAEAWATVCLAAEPGAFQRQADIPVAAAAEDRFVIWAGAEGSVLEADPDGVRLELASDARLTVRLGERREWVRPFLGGVGAAQLIPGLGQYWHPHLFAAQVSGRAVLGDETVSLDGWSAYAEHNWGDGGFPRRWWWGQSQGFSRPDVCVAFAGGDVELGPAHLQATGLIVALGGRVLRLGHPLLAPVHMETDGVAWRLHGRGPLTEVELIGDSGAEAPHVLPVPLPSERRSWPGAREHLRADVQLRVRHRGVTLFAGESHLAGLEIGGQAPPIRPER